MFALSYAKQMSNGFEQSNRLSNFGFNDWQLHFMCLMPPVPKTQVICRLVRRYASKQAPHKRIQTAAQMEKMLCMGLIT